MKISHQAKIAAGRDLDLVKLIVNANYISCYSDREGHNEGKCLYTETIKLHCCNHQIVSK